MGYDIIGDVHGQLDKLTALLEVLGYRKKDGAYRHPQGRKALFLGDLVDRGPAQVEVINAVRNMIEADSGASIMGNHEWNAIGFATRNSAGDGYLRQRTPAKCAEHAEFLRQVGDGSELHMELVDWFKTLPPFLDLGEIRLCHAWWQPDFIEAIRPNMNADGRLDEAFLLASFDKGGSAWEALEGVTKGWEIRLPEGTTFLDHNGTPRKDVRVRWWDESATTFREAALLPEEFRDSIPEIPLPEGVELGAVGEVPTFVGHYWLTGIPAVQNQTTAVLDFGAGKKGPLVAYRWDGESVLCDDKLVWAGPGGRYA